MTIESVKELLECSMTDWYVDTLMAKFAEYTSIEEITPAEYTVTESDKHAYFLFVTVDTVNFPQSRKAVWQVRCGQRSLVFNYCRKILSFNEMMKKSDSVIIIRVPEKTYNRYCVCGKRFTTTAPEKYCCSAKCAKFDRENNFSRQMHHAFKRQVFNSRLLTW